MKKLSVLCYLSLTLFASPIKASDQGIKDDPFKAIRENPLYRVTKDTPDEFYYELNNPYDLTEEEKTEIDEAYKVNGILLPEDNSEDETLYLTPEVVLSIRPALLEKACKANQWDLANNPHLSGREHDRIEAEVNIIENILQNKINLLL